MHTTRNPPSNHPFCILIPPVTMSSPRTTNSLCYGLPSTPQHSPNRSHEVNNPFSRFSASICFRLPQKRPHLLRNELEDDADPNPETVSIKGNTSVLRRSLAVLTQFGYPSLRQRPSHHNSCSNIHSSISPDILSCTPCINFGLALICKDPSSAFSSVIFGHTSVSPSYLSPSTTT